jgi:hypothetical protein
MHYLKYDIKQLPELKPGLKIFKFNRNMNLNRKLRPQEKSRNTWKCQQNIKNSM